MSIKIAGLDEEQVEVVKDEPDIEEIKKRRNKNVVKLEERLSYLTENDKYNPEIYEILKKLAKMYICQNGYTSGYTQIDDICHDVAADYWMKVINGLKVRVWTYYIGKAIKLTYINKQRKLEHQVFDARDNPKLRETIERVSASAHFSTIEEMNKVDKMVILDNIYLMIDSAMKKTPFRCGSPEFLAIRTNVCIILNSRMRGVSVAKYKYFRIKEQYIPWVNYVIAIFESELLESGFSEDLIADTGDSLSIVNDEQAMKSMMIAKG